MLRACKSLPTGSQGNGPLRGGWRLWLILLYVASLGAPALQAAVARAQFADARMVELCSSEGIRRIAVDPDGRPIAPLPLDEHGGHGCAACPPGCHHQHGLCPADGLTIARTPWSEVDPDAGHAVPIRGAATVRPPLPPRGPPILT